MKTFNVYITTTFDGSIEVQAESAEDAVKIANDLLWAGEINTLEFEPSTEVHYADEVTE